MDFNKLKITIHMKTKLIIAFLSVGLVLTSCGKKGGTNGPNSSGEIELKLNLKKGSLYDMKMVLNSQTEMNMMGQTVNSNTVMEMGMDYEVKDVLANGNYVVRTTYKTIKMSGDAMGMKYEYDSQTDKATGMQAEQMAAGMKKMLGEYAEMEMDKLGKVVKSTMSPGLSGPDGKGKGGMENMSYSVFPDKKIKVGDTWESDIDQKMGNSEVIVKTKFKLVSVSNGIAEISMDGTLELKPGTEGKITGTQKGTSKVELATGMNQEVVIDQDIDMEMNDMGMKMPMKMKNKITITTTPK